MNIRPAAEQLRYKICEFSNVAPSIPWCEEVVADILEICLKELPKFQEQKWIKCSDKLPVEGQNILNYDPKLDDDTSDGLFWYEYHKKTAGLEPHEYWMALDYPIEKDSDLLKKIRPWLSEHNRCDEEIIEFIKQHEKEKK